jgi:protein tyrosine phosphatase (PTP) superfamily phosphohydrolase (DUF442 family)
MLRPTPSLGQYRIPSIVSNALRRCAPARSGIKVIVMSVYSRSSVRASRVLAWLVFVSSTLGVQLQSIAESASPPAKPRTEHTRQGHTMARKILLKGVGDFAEITPTLYRGSQPTHEGFKELAKLGIQIVVDVRGTKRDGERKQVRKLGMEYVSIPWHCPFPNDEVFARFLKLLRDNPGKRVFVHCRLGDDRDGMMIASYRMAIEAWSAEEAMREMQTFGFTRAHHFICPGLARYEKHFPEHLKKNPIFKELRAQDRAEKAQ